MRLDDDIKSFLKQAIGDKIPEAELYLFGSRTDDEAKGGDIDVMILTNDPIDKRILRPVRIEFFKKFGWQRLDMVNFTKDDNSVFKRIIQTNAIEF